MTTAPVRRRALVVWVLGLASAMWGLLALGRDHPGSPPLHPRSWAAWAAHKEPLDVVAAVSRVVAVALVAHLLVVTVVQLATARRDTGVGHRLARRAGPRFVAVLTTAVLTSTTPAMASTAEDAGSGSHTVEPGQGATMELVPGEAETSLPWAERPLPPSTAEVEMEVEVEAQPTRPAPPPPLAPSSPTGGAANEWLVHPGDHLWSIAEEVLAGATGAGPGDAEVHDYWMRLMEANRDRLVEPDNPDLIQPGQRLRLP